MVGDVLVGCVLVIGFVGGSVVGGFDFGFGSWSCRLDLI